MDLQCPIPIDRYPVVTMAHGGGGRLMHQLIKRLFLAALRTPERANPWLEQLADGARLPSAASETVVSTDAFVVKPLVFPGGDIGSLSVHGTVNDVAMLGGRAEHLTASWILEEGLPMELLWQLACSMGAAARDCGVSVVTGDTKVVERGSGDGVFISTTGLGKPMGHLSFSPANVQPGDAIVVSGDLGRHGIAILAARNELGLATEIHSDAGPLTELVAGLLAAGAEPHCLRDLTRGGLTAALHEIAQASNTTLTLNEADIPVGDSVRGACELLGLSPLSVACEGRFVAFVPAEQTKLALDALSNAGASPVVVGTVRERETVPVACVTSLGVTRALDWPAGEQLPRIC